MYSSDFRSKSWGKEGDTEPTEIEKEDSVVIDTTNESDESEREVETHVFNLVRPANFDLRHTSSIRHLLSTDATKTLVSAFVLLHLDYCNPLLFGCPQ